MYRIYLVKCVNTGNMGKKMKFFQRMKQYNLDKKEGFLLMGKRVT